MKLLASLVLMAAALAAQRQADSGRSGELSESDCGAQRQSGAGQLLGYLVRALPQGDAATGAVVAQAGGARVRSGDDFGG